MHRDIGYWLTRGIKQGCPASGSLLALAVDPVLRRICLLLPRPVHSLGAFADEVGLGPGDI
eukprot:4119993-Pyramimonas_sp.AAC.1